MTCALEPITLSYLEKTIVISFLESSSGFRVLGLLSVFFFLSLAFIFKLCTCILVRSDIGFYPINEDNNNNNNKGRSGSETRHSRVLEMNDKLEIGLKFWQLVGSRLGF